jgi:hypothetical protein
MSYIYRNLTPGGYLEVADICFPVQVDDASLHNESALRKWSDLMLEATQKAGSPINSAKLYKSQLEIAGFCNVVEVQYKWPQNSWPANKHLKELGTCVFFLNLYFPTICELESPAFHLNLIVEPEAIII